MTVVVVAVMAIVVTGLAVILISGAVKAGRLERAAADAPRVAGRRGRRLDPRQRVKEAHGPSTSPESAGRSQSSRRARR
ncbi:MAG: hypothetical protein HOV87_05430 [Catenulispora sp.]|nr:hypothetical protein [Catenulispora sp.]